ncbi:MAG TPA: DUF3298 and DUF4163 domain-containing protein [Aggregatilineaceae bacterium]|nr:DUF3298 and DUF4163 domain-containing protein [Aggregatilineaceae bacterium]
MRNRLVVSTILAVALFGAALPVAAQQEDACFNKGGNWNAERQQCVIAFAVEVDIDYPLELTAEFPVVEEAVDRFLAEERAAFLAPIADPEFVNYTPGPLTLDIQYQSVGFSEDVLSLQFIIYTYSGGAHGMTYFRSFTFYLPKEIELSLPDLFLPDTNYLEVIAPMVQAALAEQLGDMADPDWIAQGAGPLPENYQDWVLTPDALVFTFEPYQVAAYAAGPQTVTILLADLADILAPEFSPAMAG